MIKINDKFSIERDNYNWMLHEVKDGTNKLGEPIKTNRTTYHATIKQCVEKIAERMMGKCESVQQIVDALGFFENTLDDVLAKIEVK